MCYTDSREGFPFHPIQADLRSFGSQNQCRSGSCISPRSSSSITPEHAPAGLGNHRHGEDRQKRAAPRKAIVCGVYGVGRAVKGAHRSRMRSAVAGSCNEHRTGNGRDRLPLCIQLAIFTAIPNFTAPLTVLDQFRPEVTVKSLFVQP